MHYQQSACVHDACVASNTLNYCRYLHNPCLRSSINYLKPSAAPCMARTSDLQDFTRGTICGQETSYLWQPRLVRGTICGSHTRSGDQLWGTIDSMTDPAVVAYRYMQISSVWHSFITIYTRYTETSQLCLHC